MARTENKVKPTVTNTSSELSAQIAGPEEVRLPVPLPPTGLDIPFEQAKTVPKVTSAEPDEPRPAFKSATDQATAGLTWPLRVKLLVVFGGISLLFVVAFGSAGWIFGRLTSLSDRAVTEQVRLERMRQMQTAWAGEQAAVGRVLLKSTDVRPASDFEFKVYHITFENNLFLLSQKPIEPGLKSILLDLEQRHSVLAAIFNLTLSDWQSGVNKQANQRWEDNAGLVEDLTARVATLAEEQNSIVQASQSALARGQSESQWQLGAIAGSGAVLLALLIWLANHFVIAPMGKLNVKLGQLLYSQTTRITDRLNLLEYEVETELERVAAARHDLKLPLSNIRNAAEITLICQPNLPSDVQANLNEIIETTDASATQINSLLARTDNRLQLQKANLAGLVERVLELVDLREFKLHLRVELAHATLDPELIEHVLLNLLSNARKFSAGGITIGTRLAKNSPGAVRLEMAQPVEAELWVWNDGPCIAGHERETIFRAGAQTAIGRAAGGHGLGLWIVKSIVERHGGRVVVESHDKVGTTFRVFLPYLPDPILPAEPEGPLKWPD